MTNIAKRALGLASALVFMGAMALVASPVQAADVDTRIVALERELAQLKQNQVANEERALAAEMKAPTISYAPGGGLTIAAPDKAWSLNVGMTFRIYSSFYPTHSDDRDGAGTGNGAILVVRHRPVINVTSAGGFYKLVSQWKVKDGSGVDSDLYLNFGLTNPWLPKLGIGANPSFTGAKTLGSKGRPDDSPLHAAAGLLGSQERSIVLSWSGLPPLGISSLTHLNVAIGHENKGTGYDTTVPDNSKDRSMAFGFGIKPFANVKAMGGFDVGSVAYSFGYQKLPDVYPDALAVKSNNAGKTFTLVDAGSVTGEVDYQAHGLSWNPVGFLSLQSAYVNYEASGDRVINADEYKLAADLSVWSAAGGVMGTGGITISPEYSVADVDWTGGHSAQVSNFGLALSYPVPGGGMTVTGLWESYTCKGDCEPLAAATGSDTDNSFNTFTIYLQYKF